MPKLSPLSLSDFKQIIERDAYYVDKTMTVRAILEGAAVQLHCRPRRFGKTLNLSMLHYFFDCKEDYRSLFEGLAVAEGRGDDAASGQVPGHRAVVQGREDGDYTSAMQVLTKILYEEWARHASLKGIARQRRWP
jgi:hypothetical protein